MTEFVFKPAVREQLKARLAIIGCAGSGKTYSALALAENLGKRIAVICTEHRAARKYVGRFHFDVLELTTYSPDTYVKAIAAARAYDVLVIDSLSHAWMGKDGALEQVDRAAKKNQGNSFVGWRDVTPMHNRLVDAMLSFPGHVIVTMRAKTEYVIEENERGKKVPRKVGTAPVQRDGLEYEFDIVGDLDDDHVWTITKSRCEAMDRQAVQNPGADVAAVILEWLNTGRVVAPNGAPAPTTASKNYPDKGVAGRPWADVPGDKLGEYIAYYEAKLESEAASLQANHLAAIKASLAAAGAEIERRIELESQKPIDYDRETGEVVEGDVVEGAEGAPLDEFRDEAPGDLGLDAVGA